MIKKMNSTTISKLITVHIIIAMISLLYLYIIISQFFPFAMYTKNNKIFLLVVLYLIIFFFLSVIYWHCFHNKFSQLRKFWQLYLLAFAVSIIVFSLTRAYAPLIPSKSKITIRTNDELGFMHINRENINGYLSSSISFEIIGEWNWENGVVVHQGDRLGQIIYEEVDYITNGLNYHLIFVPQSSPAVVQVELEGQVDEVLIPAHEKSENFFIYTIKAPAMNSTSLFWKTWATIFPLLRWISLFIFYLGASILIYDEKLAKFEQVLYYALLIILSFL